MYFIYRFENSEFIKGEFDFKNRGHYNAYSFTLRANNDGGVFFDEEIPSYYHSYHGREYLYINIANGNTETNLIKYNKTYSEYVKKDYKNLDYITFTIRGKPLL